MSWSGIGYPSTAGAPVQDATLLSPSTPGQTARQALWVTATVTSTITITLPSGNTIPATVATGLTILPVAATNYVVTSGTISSAYNVMTTT